jgi:hypothetical protein
MLETATFINPARRWIVGLIRMYNGAAQLVSLPDAIFTGRLDRRE